MRRFPSSVLTSITKDFKKNIVAGFFLKNWAIHYGCSLYEICSFPDPSFDLSHELNHAASFSTRSDLGEDGILLHGKIVWHNLPRLVKIKYFLYVSIVFPLLRVDLLLFLFCFVLWNVG